MMTLLFLMRRMRPPLRTGIRGAVVSAVLMLALASCASRPQAPSLAVQGVPAFKVEDYFAGRTQSWGVFEDRSGAPTRVIETRTAGRLLGGMLQFEQDVMIQGKEPTHRTWFIRALGGGRYEATGTGIVGTAQGQVTGNALHLSFTLDALPGNPLGHVHMSQWLYLQKNGRTLINRAILKKGGVVIGEITEHFQKVGEAELISVGEQYLAEAGPSKEAPREKGARTLLSASF